MVSYDPKDFEAGTGLFDEIDVQFTQVEFVMHDHLKGGNLSPYLKSVLVTDDGTEHENYWSCGSAEHMSASLDGKTPAAKGPHLCSMPVGSTKELRQSCDFAIFSTSLGNAGFRTDTLVNGLSGLEDTVAHIVRVNASGPYSKKTGKDGKEYPRTIVTATKIIRAPYDEKDVAAGSPAAVAPAGSPGVVAKLEKAVVTSLLEPDHADGLDQKALISVVMNAVDPSIKKEALELAYDVAFIGDSARPWNFVDGVIRGA